MNQRTPIEGQEAVRFGHVFARCEDVAAIVVTFNPEMDTLLRGVCAIAQQVGFVIVVDNASECFPVSRIEGVGREVGTEVRVLMQSHNDGLGAGFNVGIREARSRGYPYVVIFDQDSVPEVGMIESLRIAYRNLSERHSYIAAVGGQFRDPISGNMSYFFDCHTGIVRRVNCGGPGSVVQVGMLISAGSFISMHAIDAIGDMDESLFIDHVDTEWCLRAQARGWSLYGVCGAIMEHSLGEIRRRVWLLRWRSIALHAPFRYYYIFRNSLLLRKRGYPIPGCSRAMLKRDIMLAIYLLFVPMNRRENMKMIFRGLADGMRSITGPMP